MEKYYIAIGIEKVKELIMSDKNSLSVISRELYRRCIAHSSNQFRNVTGLTPLQFRQLAEEELKNISIA